MVQKREITPDIGNVGAEKRTLMCICDVAEKRIGGVKDFRLSPIGKAQDASNPAHMHVWVGS